VLQQSEDAEAGDDKDEPHTAVAEAKNTHTSASKKVINLVVDVICKADVRRTILSRDFIGR